MVRPIFPAATPRDIVKRVHGDGVNVITAQDVRQTFSADGAEFIPDTPGQFAAFAKTEIAK